MYSQNNEDDIIVEYFTRLAPAGHPRFLDIGAHNGRFFSNTLRLAELGWGGICVEPSPTPFAELVLEHKDRPTIELVHVALTASLSAQILPWNDSQGDGVSSLSPEHAQRWSEAVKFRKFWICTLPLSALFGQFGHDFHFLNLDVEGLNWALFQEMPWADLKFLRMICVEHDGNDAAMTAMLKPLGFEFVAMNAENLILARAN